MTNVISDYFFATCKKLVSNVTMLANVIRGGSIISSTTPARGSLNMDDINIIQLRLPDSLK